MPPPMFDRDSQWSDVLLPDSYSPERMNHRRSHRERDLGHHSPSRTVYGPPTTLSPRESQWSDAQPPDSSPLERMYHYRSHSVRDVDQPPSSRAIYGPYSSLRESQWSDALRPNSTPPERRYQSYSERPLDHPSSSRTASGPPTSPPPRESQWSDVQLPHSSPEGMYHHRSYSEKGLAEQSSLQTTPSVYEPPTTLPTRESQWSDVLPPNFYPLERVDYRQLHKNGDLSQPLSLQTIPPVYEPPTSVLPRESQWSDIQPPKSSPPKHTYHRRSYSEKDLDQPLLSQKMRAPYDSKSSKRFHENHPQHGAHPRIREPSPPPSHGSSHHAIQRSGSLRSHTTGTSRSTTFRNKSTLPRVTIPFRPTIYPNDSSSTLVGSALERKMVDIESIDGTIDTTERLEDLRRNMAGQNLDYYVIPGENAHGSESVAECDQRRQYISGFYGSTGTAIVTMSSAYLFTDAGHWPQAKEQLDHNWTLIRTGAMGEPKDWIDWLTNQVSKSRVGIDTRMISYERAVAINVKINQTNSKLIHSPQNLIDLIWKEKPMRPNAPVSVHPIEFSGVSSATKLVRLRDWIRSQPPSVLSYQTVNPPQAKVQIGTLITSLPCIAYLLNLRGSDIPYNPLFHAYLYVGLDAAILFVDEVKINIDVADYLEYLGVERREYQDLWTFLRRQEFGAGKLLVSAETSYAIYLMLTHYRYTVASSWVHTVMAVKNETELEGLKRAYLRDGASFVRFLAWIEEKLNKEYDITEFEAGSRLTEFRRHNKHFLGLSCQSVSATGSNSAHPNYTPRKSTARMVERDTPYLNASGGQYRDGTCNTARTVHFGRPSEEQRETFTRVLQSHIAIDTAIFPEGTSLLELSVLARKAFWRDGLNTHGQRFGSLAILDGPQGFSTDVVLVPGHIVINKPAVYNEGKWGMRIESTLAVKRVKTKRESNGHVWLGFERLTCVPIQTRMVKDSLLTKEEQAWLKEHNQRCGEKLAPLIDPDKRAVKWLKRQAGSSFFSKRVHF